MSNQKKKRKNIIKREFLEFGDWVAKMYPELHPINPNKSDGETGILSRTFTFQVTDKCNLACTYCYQINKSTRRMSFETAKLAVDKLLSGEDGFGEYINPTISPAIILDFIGGEPFLEIELIDKTVDYFRERAIELNHPWANKFCISICSNGVLYTNEKVQKFLQKNQQITSFSVTVDGIKELHDACRLFPDGRPSYDIAHHAAMDWMARGYEMGSKITISPSNITYLSKSLQQMVADGYYDINANYVYEEGWKLEHATEAYNQIKDFTDKTLMEFDMNDYSFSFLENNGTPMTYQDNQNWCGGTGAMLSMDPDGKLFPCIRYMESSLGTDQKPLIIGDVRTGLVKKPDEKECIKCMNKITRRTQSTDECWFCPVAEGCGWCSGYNYQVFGTVDKRATFTCIVHKARSLATAYYINSHIKSGDVGEPQPVFLCKHEAIEIIGEENYKELVELTKSVGGYVNTSDKELAKIKEEKPTKKKDWNDSMLIYFNKDDKETIEKINKEEKDLIDIKSKKKLEKYDKTNKSIADAKEAVKELN